MTGLTDRSGLYVLKMAQHVLITHPRHSYYGRTGTIVRIQSDIRRVWVQMTNGTIVPAGHRSVEVIVPRTHRRGT